MRRTPRPGPGRLPASGARVADQLLICITVQALNARNRTDITAIHRLAKLINRQKFTTSAPSFLAHANAAAAAAKLLTTKKSALNPSKPLNPIPSGIGRSSAAHCAAEKIIVPSPSLVARSPTNGPASPKAKSLLSPTRSILKDFPTSAARPIKTAASVSSAHSTPSNASAISSPPFPISTKITLEIFSRAPSSPLPIPHRPTESILAFTSTAPSPAPRRPAKYDVLVLPSQAEGFGLVLIEAMAAGIPVIGTNVPGIRDVITANQTGLLVPPQSPRAPPPRSKISSPTPPSAPP